MHRATAALLVVLGVAACQREPARVRIALGVPDVIARSLLREFGQAADVEVEAQPPTARGPCADCDVVWSSDPDASAGLDLAPLPGGDYGRPPSMVGPEHRWIAASAVARVLVYDPARVSEDEAPITVMDLARPAAARRLVMADPARGDASWYAAALFGALGEPRARALYRDMVANGARVVDDEDAVVNALTAGERPIALTDSDRAFAAQGKQPTLVISVPDQEAGGLGAFLIPAVVGITLRGTHNSASLALVEFLLSAPVARRIAMTADSILVLNDPAEIPAGPLSILRLQVMPVSYPALAARLSAVRDALRVPALAHNSLTAPAAGR